ncbi:MULTISPECIES: MerR family transcriptional regulator [Streptomyces]|uniref:MerR family transcriptional regulator n=1 Tax=Streptomyces prasinosporus TaxID=68256 RepID=A0ABP6TH76_9ACTN|nr:MULTISPECIES: MerR family transcriptional regulator [Streptomyces]GHC26638.1 transcriptional regulator [Streptomyces albogriseolus]MCX4571442.1 MerR family transcriptional regulator [Streptomyces viridodiastaticus]MCX4624751.1 MerR family transcriptional regulator [Streptomyces viridodiastaticus]NIL50832.1 MerR family transcriptional regulator [Streptomyces sp. 2BBP-J2]GHG42343.1 transcriptional regulator [Streptomyces viridodiastaticus]
MRISELSRRSGVSIPTIKYYLRDGLLPAGRPTAANQAEYDEDHVRRLRLIRSLIGVRGLSVSATKDVLAAVDEQQGDVHLLLGLVLGALPVERSGRPPRRDGAAEPAGAGAAAGDAAEDVAALTAEMGWKTSPNPPAAQVVAETLETMRALGVDYDWRSLVPYAELADRAARLDLDQLRDAGDPLQQAERAVLLTVLLEPALLALRRLAQEHHSALRFGNG